jgi:PAS domain S-box-containing protein
MTAEPVNVLLVDDTPAKLLTYEVMLADLGQNLLKAGSAEEAFRVLLSSEVALVVTDVSMPSLDGFQFAKMLREHPRFTTTAIILVSAIALSELDVRRGYESGALDYVTVPVSPELFRSKVKVFVELHRKQRELERFKRELEERVALRTTELQASEERLRLLANSTPAIVWSATADGEMSWASQRWYDYTGISPDRKVRDWTEVVHPDDCERCSAAWKAALNDGSDYAIQVRNRRHDGIYRWFVTRAVAQLDQHGHVIGWFGSTSDIDDLKRCEERQNLLGRELRHRTNNLLSVIQFIAQRSLADDRDIAEAREAFIARLHALSNANELLTNSSWQGASINDVVCREMAAFSNRVSVEGPHVMLNPSATQGMVLVVHELATNAARHGALVGDGAGHVSVRWSIETIGKEPHLHFEWQERDGPLVTPPTRRGFGTTLLERAIGSLTEPPHIEYAPEGLTYSLNVPLSSVGAGSSK